MEKETKFLRRGQLPILIVNVIALIGFAIHYVSRENYEFVLYIGVIAVFLILILLTNKVVRYPNWVLWGLTIWALMHMGGGTFYLGGTLLYKIILIPISAEYGIFRYDQLVHIFGFMVATWLMYAILRPKLDLDNAAPKCRECELLKNSKTSSHNGFVVIGIITVMAGLGVGALNEILEFIATVFVPETGVGGYINTSLDLVADLVGALLAWIVIWLKNGKV